MSLSQFAIRGKMKVGEDDLSRTHSMPFGADGFFDLDDQFSRSPYGIGVLTDLRPGGPVLLIAEAAAIPCAAFHPDVVSRPNQGGNPDGTSETRYSLILISFGTPIIMPVSVVN